jgi:hypothetical protein
VRCLQRKLDRLARSLHPVTVSTALLAEDIIEQRVWEEARKEGLPHYDRCLNVLEAVMRCLGARPSVFEQFCKILEQETVTENLAAELRGTNFILCSYRSNCMPHCTDLGIRQAIASPLGPGLLWITEHVSFELNHSTKSPVLVYEVP